MSDSVLKNPQGFSFGYNAISDISNEKLAMNFGVLKLKTGDRYTIEAGLEMACLLMTGNIDFESDKQHYQGERCCYFYQSPFALHFDATKTCQIKANTNSELMIIQTANDKRFETIYFSADNMLENDERGKGLLNDTSHRLVRTIFDKRNRAQSNLVLGEIITYPGHWSSTPSHTHPHPEIYHYRFSEPKGYAFGEDGAEVVRIEHGDTLLITDSKAHAHSTAPGYCLYTLWFIRHLKNNPYITPEFQPQHAWAKDQCANRRVWQPLVET